MAHSQPIFLLAHERSGTNLLRRILGRHSAIAAPPPTHLLNWLVPYEDSYGELTCDENFNRLIEDAWAISKLSFDPWPDVTTAARMRAGIASRERSVLAVFLWMHDSYAKQEGAPRWFCKDKNLIDQAQRLNAARSDARFIFMHRDPRDVYASYKDAVGGFKHPQPFAENWARMHEECVAFSDGPAKVIRLSYESLIADPESVIRDVCEFLGLEFDSGMLETDDRVPRSDNSYWKNISRGIMRDNAAKYRSLLSKREIRIIEERAFSVMGQIGYAPEIASGPKRSSAAARFYYRAISSARQRWRLLTADMDAHESLTVKRRRAMRKALRKRGVRVHADRDGQAAGTLSRQ